MDTISTDNRISELPGAADRITLKELCEILSISAATGRNWIRLGKLIPESSDKKTPYFTREYVETLKANIESGENKALKSRRNKKYVSGNALYNSYVSEQCRAIASMRQMLTLIDNLEIELNDSVIRLLVADCALHLFMSKKGTAASNAAPGATAEAASDATSNPASDANADAALLLQFLKKELSVGAYDELILALIEDSKDLEGLDATKNLNDIASSIAFCEKYQALFGIDYQYEPNEDILGLMYISLKNIGNRKATGSYYTSTKVVKNLIGKLDIQAQDTTQATCCDTGTGPDQTPDPCHGIGKILDPCCGTGNFLLQLPAEAPFAAVYGNDTDPISVKITRLNMALKYEAPVTEILEHITELDYLSDYHESGFRYIIGNPPWGYEFTEEEKKAIRTRFRAPSGKNIESYELFIEQAFRHLAEGGHLAYVLPESFLNVKAHTNIRQILLQQCSIRNLDYLGNAFDGVQCPCIILDLAYTGQPLSTQGMTVSTDSSTFTINTERTVTADYFSFLTDDPEYTILQKIRNHDHCTYLAGNADFALGIVTGNNKAYISDVKTAANEMILKGSDISKYHINPTANYIVFQPERFQQVAPTELYRAQEKLLYRFISSQLVFAYDDKQTLSLNSCNIVIPRIAGIKTKYILAILNSRIAQFIYKKEFNSVKVLRAHIESIPIPYADEAQQDAIIALTDRLINGLDLTAAEAAYEELDQLISDIFRLDPNEIEIIKQAVDGENKFLA